MPWNVIPGTKQESTNTVVPVSALYTPIKPFPNMPVLPYAPLRCRTCRSVLNPFSTVDYSAKIWICPFCFTRNHFPPHYATIFDGNLPAELFPQYTTIEYDSSLEKPAAPLVFIFVIDTCMIKDGLSFLKSALSQALGLLPDQSLVGLITFGFRLTKEMNRRRAAEWKRWNQRRKRWCWGEGVSGGVGGDREGGEGEEEEESEEQSIRKTRGRRGKKQRNVASAFGHCSAID